MNFYLAYAYKENNAWNLHVSYIADFIFSALVIIPSKYTYICFCACTDLAVPAEVDSYHSLFPLEPLPPPNRIQKTSNFGYITSCYKAVNSKDDLPYCLRRIHGEKNWVVFLFFFNARAIFCLNKYFYILCVELETALIELFCGCKGSKRFPQTWHS